MVPDPSKLPSTNVPVDVDISISERAKPVTGLLNVSVTVSTELVTVPEVANVNVAVGAVVWTRKEPDNAVTAFPARSRTGEVPKPIV